MSKLSMTVGGRELTMRFDLKAWTEIDETFGSLEDMRKKTGGKEKPMVHSLQMTAIMANAGERYAGRQPDMTPEWLQEHLTPKQAQLANSLAKLAIAAGMKRENVNDEDDGPVDVVAEEIQKKTEKA